MITGPQCRAARALVELSREKVAKLSGIDVDVIAKFENQIDVPPADVVERLKDTLEQAGAVFIPEGTRGIGVRLKFTASETKRLGILENEGGLARPDDVP